MKASQDLSSHATQIAPNRYRRDGTNRLGRAANERNGRTGSGAADHALPDANRQLHQWVMSEAGNRVHGTTREQPLARFALGKPLLTALPDVPPVLAEWTQVSVHRNCHVQFDKALYSAPCKLAGRTLWQGNGHGRAVVQRA